MSTLIWATYWATFVACNSNYEHNSWEQTKVSASNTTKYMYEWLYTECLCVCMFVCAFVSWANTKLGTGGGGCGNVGDRRKSSRWIAGQDSTFNTKIDIKLLVTCTRTQRTRLRIQLQVLALLSTFTTIPIKKQPRRYTRLLWLQRLMLLLLLTMTMCRPRCALKTTKRVLCKLLKDLREARQ